ncbi:MAG TPA: hypothetical protein VE553_05160 [Candidatus Binatia bacterium]|nr:hypothetical protein [Candidatus Binatia bacterium]
MIVEVADDDLSCVYGFQVAMQADEKVQFMCQLNAKIQAEGRLR